MADLDNVAQDGVALASTGVKLLVGIGGIGAGIALAASDMSFGLLDNLIAQFGIENAFFQKAISLLGVGALFALGLMLRNVVSSNILKALFGFVVIMLGTYLLVKMVGMFITLLTTGNVEED